MKLTPLNFNANTLDQYEMAADYLARQQSTLGAMLLGQRWFYKQYRDERGHWHTDGLDLSKWVDLITRNYRTCNWDYAGMIVVDIESDEALGAALRGDVDARADMRLVLEEVRSAFPKAKVLLYGPRLPRWDNADRQTRENEWRDLVPVLAEPMDPGGPRLLDGLAPPLNTIDIETDGQRFRRLVVMSLPKKRPPGWLVAPIIYKQKPEDKAHYDLNVRRATDDKPIAAVLDWDYEGSV